MQDPGAGRVDHLEVRLAPHPLQLVGRNAVGADDEGSPLDLVGQVGGADAAIRQVGLDAGVVHQLAEGGDLLPLVARVLGLVNGKAHAVAESGALRDANLRSKGGAHAPILSGQADIGPAATLAGARRSPA